MDAWSWDPSLYAGSARHYVDGRVAYPQPLFTQLAEILGLDGTQRLIDVGCGPGSLTLPLAGFVGTAIGLDPDPSMLAEAARLAAERGVGNVAWRQLRAEELPAGLPRADLVTFAQSFHWMERDRVAALVRAMLTEQGALVHVHGSTQRGEPVPGAVAPPWDDIEGLIARYLGPQRRAGRGVRAAGPDDEDAVYRRAGFVCDRRLQVPGPILSRSVSELVASVHSLSWAAPHLFGDRLPAFDDELRSLLVAAEPADGFTEQFAPTAADVYR